MATTGGSTGSWGCALRGAGIGFGAAKAGLTAGLTTGFGAAGLAMALSAATADIAPLHLGGSVLWQLICSTKSRRPF